MTESIAAPSAPRTRDTLPDLLRGIALLGIVVVNAPYLGISAEGFSAASVASTIDAAVAFAVVALAQGKFYLLFSFLFGYSLSYVLRDDRPSGRARYRRRLIVLAVLGVAHAALLFVGDILLTYAILGALLLRFSRADEPRLLRASRMTFALGAGLLVVALGLGAAFPEEAAMVNPAAVAYDASMATATFAEATMLRLDALPTVLGTVAFAQGPLAFAAFLLGLAAARRRLLADPAAHVDRWRRYTRIGIGVGLPLQLVAAALQVSAIRAGTPYATTGALGVMLGFVTAPLLSAGYLGLLAGRLARDPGFMRWSWPAGRMSLTVYLGQSVLLMLAFSGTGLGLFGSLGTAAVVAIGIGTWVVLTVFAALWLRRSDRGPLEWAVARLTTPRSATRAATALVMGVVTATVVVSEPASAQGGTGEYTYACEDGGVGLHLVDVLEATGEHATFLDLMRRYDPEGLAMLSDVVLADKTVWAPTDAAFAALGDTLTSLSDAEVKEVLGFHISPPRRSPGGAYPIVRPQLLLDAGEMGHRTRTGVLTGSDQRTRTTSDDGVLRIEGITIGATAWCAEAGSVLAIDGVITDVTPPSRSVWLWNRLVRILLYDDIRFVIYATVPAVIIGPLVGAVVRRRGQPET